ncbi:MAG: hypothetical protein Q9173_001678, partial [Seirophora scorigena]
VAAASTPAEISEELFCMMPNEKDTFTPTGVKAAAFISTSTSDKPPLFTEEGQNFIAALYFNYEIDVNDLQISLAEENRVVLLADELSSTPSRTASEIRAELTRICKNIHQRDREPRPWDIFLRPPEKTDDKESDFDIQLEKYAKVFYITHSIDIGRRKDYCRDRIRVIRGDSLHEDPQKLGMAAASSFGTGRVPDKEGVGEGPHEVQYLKTVLEILDERFERLRQGWPYRRKENSQLSQHLVSEDGVTPSPPAPTLLNPPTLRSQQSMVHGHAIPHVDKLEPLTAKETMTAMYYDYDVRYDEIACTAYDVKTILESIWQKMDGFLGDPKVFKLYQHQQLTAPEDYVSCLGKISTIRKEFIKAHKRVIQEERDKIFRE